MISLKNKTCLIDLDGTIYAGDRLIDGAIEFITYLQKKQIAYYFITNNASRTHKQNAQKLLEMGFSNIREADFFTSAMASAAYIAHHSDKRTAFYIGQDGMHEALTEQGFVINETQADFVFIGLDQSATYESYCKAFNLVEKGAMLVGTNKDRRLPHGDGFRIGNGAVVEMFAYASGQTPLIIGKPYSYMLEEALLYANVKKEDCIIIGDNLETDILFGTANEVETIFVTSGVHKKEDVEALHIQPTYTIDNLIELCI